MENNIDPGAVLSDLPSEADDGDEDYLEAGYVSSSDDEMPLALKPGEYLLMQIF